jgi:hypothetical protein
MYLQETNDGLLVFDSDMTTLEEVECDPYIRSDLPRPIMWLKPLTERNQTETAYVAYGNEPSLDYAYGEICLILEVNTFKDRETYHE